LKYLVGPSLVCSLIINAIFAQLGQGYIQVDNAVSLVKSTIAQMFSNSMDFPTRSSKMRALLKKNEWYIPVPGFSEQQNTEIMDRACSELGQEIWNVKISDEQKAKDKEIDGLMQKIRMDLQGNSLDEQAAALQKNEETGTLSQLLQNPEVKAKHAVLAGIARQKLVEATEAESLVLQRAQATEKGLTEESPQWPQERQSIFEKTSAGVQFYSPIPGKEQAAIKERKEMSPNQWESYRSKQRIEEADKQAKLTEGE